MAKGMTVEPLPQAERTIPSKKTRKLSCLDASGRARKPGKQNKKIDQPTVAPIIVRKKKKSRAEKEEAKKRHAITQADIELIRKRTRILGLREQGASIRQISEQMIKSGEDGCSPASVYDHLVAALEDLVENYTLKTKHVIQLRLNQLYRVELSHFSRLCDSSLKPDDFEKMSRGMKVVWDRMDVLIDQLNGTGKRTAVVEMKADPGVAAAANIRVIMPTITEDLEPDNPLMLEGSM